jgi:hypothetical protein
LVVKIKLKSVNFQHCPFVKFNLRQPLLNSTKLIRVVAVSINNYFPMLSKSKSKEESQGENSISLPEKSILSSTGKNNNLA